MYELLRALTYACVRFCLYKLFVYVRFYPKACFMCSDFFFCIKLGGLRFCPLSDLDFYLNVSIAILNTKSEMSVFFLLLLLLYIFRCQTKIKATPYCRLSYTFKKKNRESEFPDWFRP